MKVIFSLLLATFLACGPVYADSPFSLQGRLYDGALPAVGNVVLRVTPWDSESNGAALATPVVTPDLPLIDGVFTTSIDFGELVFLGAPVWLQIEVEQSGGGFVALTPRQPVTATPYAMLAQSVAVNAVDGFALQDGAVTTTKLAPGAVDATRINALQVQRRIDLPCAEGTVMQAVAQNGTPSCVSLAETGWTLQPDGRQQSDVGVVIQPADAASLPALTMQSGNQWSPSVGSGRGDLHIGNASVGLSFGVALVGGGTGVSRIWTKGGVEHLYLGSDTNRDVLAIVGNRVGIDNSNPQATLHVGGDARILALAHAETAPRRLSATQNGTLTAGAVRTHSVPRSAFSIQSTLYQAPLQLPDGAVLDRMDVWYMDNSSGHVVVQLCILDLATDDACATSAIFQSSGASAAVRSIQVPFGPHAMNNTAHAATVIAAAVSGGAAAALSGNLDIRAVNFRYRE